MQPNIVWKKLFSKKHIKEHYFEKVKQKPSVGLDRKTTDLFEQNLDEEISIIQRKLNNNTYKFTRYKQLLISKGANKNPRILSVPTVRDKLTLSILNEVLSDIYGESCVTPMPHKVINEIKNNLNKFDSFIKIDIKGFYSSINREKLIEFLLKRIHKKEIKSLIQKAIETETIAFPAVDNNEDKKVGIPEGLSISNTLANLFLSDVDEKYKSIEEIRYWRYVDDILIFLNDSSKDKVYQSINFDLTSLGLEINQDKYKDGEIKDGVEYLGYWISNKLISVRKSNIYKLENSIEEILRSRNKNNEQIIEWKLNNKITGFVFNENKYGS